MRLDELRSLVAAGSVHTVVVAVTDHVGRMLGKRLDAGFFLDEVADRGTHACDYLATVDVTTEPLPGFEVANWSRGYGDVHLRPDLDTLRPAGWAPGTAWVLCDVAAPHDDRAHGSVAEVWPRVVLRRQLRRLAEHGLSAQLGFELEFHLYERSYRELARSGFDELPPAGWTIEDYHLLQGARHEPLLADVRRGLVASGIGVEGTKGEAGIGQHELNLRHADALRAADEAALARHVVKEVADRADRAVTFMAKPADDHAGSGLHVHLSLWADGANHFAADGSAFERSLGGWVAHAPEVMLWYAPTVNSAKRFRDDSWAPTSIAWARDNRTAAFRVVGDGPAKRIECRLPCADANPYLVAAASIAACLAGLDHDVPLGPPVDGDAYRTADLPPVHRSLAESADAFATSSMAREAFGDVVVDHYVHHARLEAAAAAAAVTDWERRRYFEQV